MTRTANARIAGWTLLLYIAIGITQMVVSRRTTRGDAIAAQLTSMTQNAGAVRGAVLLGLLTCFVALALAVALYAITREQDADLAMLALSCRVAEALLGAVYMSMTLGLLSVLTAGGQKAIDASETQAVASFVMAARRWNPLIAATFFAVGSTIFSWLLLRGRTIPVMLAWLGVLASALLAIGLPLQLAGILRGAATQIMWLPMAAFEIPLALWLLVKGVKPPQMQPVMME